MLHAFVCAKRQDEVKPPSEAKPGSMLNVSAPWHGFMPVMVPQGWTAGATIRVQYEVPSDATPSRDLIALQKRRLGLGASGGE